MQIKSTLFHGWEGKVGDHTWHRDNIRYWRDFYANLHNLIFTFLQKMELANNFETLFYTEFVIKYFAMK